MSPASMRLLSIGEFAAATQLSAKALRVYDEQRLLPPARVDANTGYRYYGRDQVPRGRLVRTLREAGLALAEIAAVLDAGPGVASVLLGDLAREQDQRHAREKRAFQSALIMLHRPAPADVPGILERAYPETLVAVAPFTAERATLIERFLVERSALLERLSLPAHTPVRCALVDPLTDDAGQMEAVVPLRSPAALPEGVTVRRMAAGTCAVIALAGALHASELTSAVDAMFDWFDRSACRAVGAPWLEFPSVAGSQVEVVWMFSREPARAEE